MSYVWNNAVWTRVGDKPVILVFARDTETREAKRFAIKGFKPYFYIDDPDGNLQNCYGKPISKVVVNTPDEVAKKRKEYEAKGIDTYDSDIVFEMRYFIDKHITYGFDEHMKPVDTDVLLPRVCFYDIEVDIPTGEGIDETHNKYPIVAISVLDSYTGEKRVFTLHDQKVHELETCCKTEREVITNFVNYVKENDFDILTGWFNIRFDAPYIFGRARVVGASLRGLTRTNVEPRDPERLTGRSHIDMLEFFRDWSKPMGRQVSYDLKYIAKTHADFEYKDYGEHIHTLIQKGEWDIICDYSLKDVEALARIDEKFGLIAYHENLRRIIGIKFDFTIKRIHIVETLLLRHGIKPIPPRKKHERADFEGAFVVQPTTGIKKNVIFLDAKTLYPSIIIAFNLSPDIDKMIPKTITYILNEREKYRKLKMDGKATESDLTTEQSLKYIANSFYGVMGSPYFKLYQPSIASFITGKGREINQEIRDLVTKLGYTVIYGDTDSVAISPVKSIEEGQELEAHVNKYLLEWAHKYGIPDEFAPVVKFEKYFKQMFFKKKTDDDRAAKKKYVGHLIWKDGKDVDKLDYTGVEIRRSDTAPYTKVLMENFFTKVLIDGDSEAAVALIHEAIKEVKSGKVLIQDIAIPKGMKMFIGNSAWQKGVTSGTYLFQIKFNSSKKPKLIYCKSPYKEVCIDDNVTDADVRAKVTVDWDKMADRVVSQKMRSLVESIGYDWSGVSVGQVSIDDVINQYGGK